MTTNEYGEYEEPESDIADLGRALGMLLFLYFLFHFVGCASVQKAYRSSWEEHFWVVALNTMDDAIAGDSILETCYKDMAIVPRPLVIQTDKIVYPSAGAYYVYSSHTVYYKDYRYLVHEYIHAINAKSPHVTRECLDELSARLGGMYSDMVRQAEHEHWENRQLKRRLAPRR